MHFNGKKGVCYDVIYNKMNYHISFVLKKNSHDIQSTVMTEMKARL